MFHFFLIYSQFNRCITSQLIKWFSNFREFYYIQMEKFARQAIVDGVSDMNDMSVTRDSEVFRALNMHYNKANDFQVRFLSYMLKWPRFTVSVTTWTHLIQFASWWFESHFDLKAYVWTYYVLFCSFKVFIIIVKYKKEKNSKTWKK